MYAFFSFFFFFSFYKAAAKAAADTKEMDAQAGRASYVNKSLLNKPDPGAVAVASWLSAVAAAL